jgi:DNA-binding MarR family transcriptional regulator
MNTMMIVQAWQSHAAAKFCFVSFAGRRMKLGLSEVAVLELLQVKGKLSPGDIGSYLSMPSGSVTALLDRLEYKKFIARKASPSDRRTYTVVLSPGAIEKAQADLVPMAQSIERIASELSEEGQKAVVEFLGRVSQALLRAVERKTEN